MAEEVNDISWGRLSDLEVAVRGNVKFLEGFHKDCVGIAVEKFNLARGASYSATESQDFSKMSQWVSFKARERQHCGF